MADKLLHVNSIKMLQRDWTEAKSKGMTQLEMSKKLGITQPTFSQYLRGTIPLNLSFLISYATVRKVPLTSVGIVESIAEFKTERLWLRVERTTAGVRFKERFVEMSGIVNTGNAYLVEVDSDFRTFPKGSFLVCEALPCAKGSLVTAAKGDAFLVGTLVKYDTEWAVVEPFASGDKATTVDETWLLRKITSVVFSPTDETAEVF